MNRRSLTRRTSAAIAIGLLATVGLAGSPRAASSSAKQRVAIDARIPWHLTGATFKLVPLTNGAIQPDSGEVLFAAGGRTTHGVREGQAYDRIRDSITFAGKRGTLVLAEDNYVVSSGADVSVFTGTWKIAHGSGAYKGLSGGGRTAGLIAQRYAPFPNRWEGSVSTP